jgi:hypothetical protein
MGASQPGSLVDGTLGWRRAMPSACHNIGLAVGALETWNRFNLWRFLR